MDTLIQDVRVALRSFRRSPGFALTAIATLALGIGATTAIFTALSAVLLKPLPYPHADDLYSLRTTLTDGRVTTGLLSGGELIRSKEPTANIARVAGYNTGDLTLLADDNTPTHVQVFGVSEGFFELFGLPLTLGGFSAQDFVPVQPQANGQQQQGPLPRIIISQRIWKSRYNSDRDIVGKPIHFAELTTSIAGVAPRDFDIPHGGDFWFAQPMRPADVGHNFTAFMRLKPGATLARASAEQAAIMQGLAVDYPSADRGRAFVSRPLVDAIVGDLGPILIIVMSATGLLLLLACVNVGNLLLARGAARAREMAVRAALGAGWGRLVRQLLTESLVLAAAGTIAGVALGTLGLRVLLAIGASRLPRLDAVQFDGRALIFAIAMLLLTGTIIGLAPAMRLARGDMKALMNDSSRSASAGRGTTRWLVSMTVAEVALAVMLLAGAGWLVRGFADLRRTDAGFVPDKRVLFDVALRGEQFRTLAGLQQGQNELTEVLRRIPGVSNAGLMTAYPLRGSQENVLLLQLNGEAFDPTKPSNTAQRFIGPGGFAAMGTSLIKGRDFQVSDVPTSVRVAIVNKTFADRYLAGRDPIGAQFTAGYPVPDSTGEVTVVGVVNDVRQKSLAEAAQPAYYTSMTQNPIGRATAVVEFSRPDVGGVERAIRAEIKKFDPSMALDFTDASAMVRATLSRQELGMTLMLLFGIMAVVLAAVGIYGVVSYTGSLRRGEMATRLALGASPRSVFLLVLRQGATLGLIGAGVGIALAYASGRLVSSRVYAIQASDPVILSIATVLIASITILATAIPALRAARLSPADSLQA